MWITSPRLYKFIHWVADATASSLTAKKRPINVAKSWFSLVSSISLNSHRGNAIWNLLKSSSSICYNIQPTSDKVKAGNIGLISQRRSTIQFHHWMIKLNLPIGTEQLMTLRLLSSLQRKSCFFFSQEPVSMNTFLRQNSLTGGWSVETADYYNTFNVSSKWSHAVLEPGLFWPRGSTDDAAVSLRWWQG